MKTKIVEATNGPQNHGKFMVAEFDEAEWKYRSVVDPCALPLMRSVCGWGPGMLWVLDLQTGEGAFFRHGGHPVADLDKHRVWVCPLFEPFLVWLYDQDVSDLDALPDHVDLPDAEFHMYGYRRPGPEEHDVLDAIRQIVERSGFDENKIEDIVSLLDDLR